MPAPAMPSLNGRNIAEFFTSRESVKRNTLRRYARPPQEQTAPIVLYDPIRKVISEYFKQRRDDSILERVVKLLDAPSTNHPDFIELRRKSNRTAIFHLRQMDFGGEFADVYTARLDIEIQRLRVKSTIDFFATLMPNNKRSKPRHVGVIVNLSGINKREPGEQEIWSRVESEIALRCAMKADMRLDEILYADLRREHIFPYRKPKARLWEDIDATCERIVREWREIRLEMTRLSDHERA